MSDAKSTQADSAEPHSPVALADIEAAAERIRGAVRRTPNLAAEPLKDSLPLGELVLKLENLQVTGSFKARGASNTLFSLPEDEVRRGIITASGGNHGLAVAYAGWRAETRAVIYLPASTPEAKVEKLRAWGAEVVVEGAVWDDAKDAALTTAEAEGLTFIHPFDDPRVVAGQGTVGIEILEDDPGLDYLFVAIGGGGLISGVATAVKALKPSITVIGVEPTGAPTLKESLAAKELVTLPEITTAAGTLAPRRSAALNLEIIGRTVDEIVLVSDGEMAAAARSLWFELGIAAELSGAAALAAIQKGRFALPQDARVGALVCGAGTDGIA
ncbi:MAG: threonine/serine dehydratase [Kiloniellales bacterium]|nr:threonine/serine dehydratase [Kiloniellales bacterium]